MVRASAAVLVVITLMTGCAGQARRPAMVIGGALAVGGVALAAHASSADCQSGDLDADVNCFFDTSGAMILSLAVVSVGVGLLVGAALGGGGESAPEAARPTSAWPAPVAAAPAVEAPPEDPANPTPAMEPEPASW